LTFKAQKRKATEFDEYRDICDSDQWKTVSEDGTITSITGPVFVDGEITWRPSTK
jgi:hypothetical protein